MKFGSTIASVLLFFPLMAAAACQPMCCDAIVASLSPPGHLGINCHAGGLYCDYEGQVAACCARLTSALNAIGC
ncbi:hypothetical protein GALMADRAFT_1076623 [Galerina marginata CBS 339.88]|uniref:Hydrophobin n=1 Tax=Galerina marginata (strain CBS 339.88) TaxID=685588 RepID=A0A067SIG6_GALM3|nr:hypothetical protein GALMADRAFT_1076623 [Galerina marginata CBS 339.88]